MTALFHVYGPVIHLDPKLLLLDEPRNPFQLSSDTNHSSENPHSHTNKPDLLECRIDR